MATQPILPFGLSVPQAVQAQAFTGNQSTAPISAGDTGFGSIAVQLGVSAALALSGAFGGGTVTFQGSIDGVTYFAMAMYALSSSPGLVVTTAVAAGIFRTVDATGINFFQLVMAGATTPQVAVLLTWNAIR